MSKDVNEELDPSTSEEVDENVAAEEQEEIKLDRPMANLVAEITRKVSEPLMKSQEQMFAQLADMQQSANKQTPEPVQQKTGLDAYTLDQLEDHAATLEETDPMKKKIEKHVSDRIIHETIAQQVGAFTSEQRLEDSRREWGRKAMAKFPDLEDTGSDFFKKVDAELKTMDPGIVRTDPRAAYNAAHIVAASEGVKSAPRRQVTKPAATKGSAKPADVPNDDGPSDNEIDEMSRKLQGALPKGKKFDKERIRERSKYYQTNLKHHLRG
jgi:hypothetical protein